MRLVLHSELTTLSEKELCAMFARVSANLARTQQGSPARRNALATLENINRAQAARWTAARSCP